MFDILPGNALKLQLKKPGSRMTNFVTSLTNNSFACLEFKDDSQVLFAGGNNNQLYNLLKSFKEDLAFKVQKAVVIRLIKEKGGGIENYQVNMIT